MDCTVGYRGRCLRGILPVNRVYFNVVTELSEKESNDTKEYANTVIYGLPMIFYLDSPSDVDWFKLLPASDVSGNVSVTITVEYSGASSLSNDEARLCKYSLYDSTMQQWGAGSFSFSKSEPTASTTRTLPNGPLYLKMFFDTSHNSNLLPVKKLTLKMVVN